MPIASRSPHAVVLIVLAGLGMVGPFSIDTIFPAFAELGRTLRVSEVALQQLVSTYLLAFAVMSLFHGPISDSVGRKPVIIVGGLIFTAASVGCALAPDLGWLLVLRALQGASAGAGQIISRAMVSDLFVQSEAQRVMSHIAMIFGLAPAVAPIFGGWLLLVGDWRSIFWFLAAFGLLLVLLTVVALPESNPPGHRRPLHVVRLLGSLWAVLKHPGGRRLAVNATLNFAGMFLYISSAPLFIVKLLGRGDQDFWMLFVPLIGGMVGGSWLAGRLAGRIRGARIASLGYAISLAGGAGNLLLALVPTTASLPWSVLVLPVYSFGIAMAFPILTLTMLELFPASRGAASSVQSFVTLVFNAFLAGVLAPLVAYSLWLLATVALGFTLGAWLLWRHHLAVSGLEPPSTPNPQALEPMET